jgi:hypothetical protein
MKIGSHIPPSISYQSPPSNALRIGITRSLSAAGNYAIQGTTEPVPVNTRRGFSPAPAASLASRSPHVIQHGSSQFAVQKPEYHSRPVSGSTGTNKAAATHQAALDDKNRELARQEAIIREKNGFIAQLSELNDRLEREQQNDIKVKKDQDAHIVALKNQIAKLKRTVRDLTETEDGVDANTSVERKPLPRE